jgi:Protein of unknown function (DUF3467)
VSSEPQGQNEPSGQPQSAGEPGAYTQEIKHQQVTARVPERVGRGIFSTGALVLQGPHEFVIDFVIRIAMPHQVAARIVLPFSLIPNLIQALRENLNNYQKRFGPPPTLPAPPPNTPVPTIEEIYDQLKQPDEVMSGCYANAVMIAHTPSEFCFDFITNFYPRSAVSSRVYLAAPQVPRFLETLTRSFEQYRQKLQPPRPPAPPEGAGPALPPVS